MAITKQARILAYINENPMGILGTVDADGRPHGAAMYIYAKEADEVYMVTKKETRKFKNILRRKNVSLTIANIDEDSTLQATGRAYVVEDAKTIEAVMERMAHIYTRGADWLPPIAKLRAGPYEVVGVKLNVVRLAMFKVAKPGDKDIFIEL